MFFVFNKQKIYSYIVAASTVVILFVLSAFFSKDDVNAIETTSNITVNNVILENEIQDMNKIQ